MKQLLIALLLAPVLIMTAYAQQETTPQKKPAVTYEQILGALKFQAPEEVILERIKKSGVVFTLGARQIQELKKAGASQKIIQAMQSGPKGPGDITDIVLILDCSGSMLDKTKEGASKMEAAKQAVRELLAEIPNGRRLALILYGHDKAAGCEAVELVRSLTPLDSEGRSDIRDLLKKLEPAGATPIAKSLQLAGEVLAEAKGLSQVILVTDGMETCKGKPAEAAASLAKNHQLPHGVSVVGFKVTETERAAVEDIAKAGSGQYISAESSSELARRMQNIGSLMRRPAKLPAGISVGKGLEVLRWATFRRITNFNKDQNVKIHDLELSGNGERIAFGTSSGVWIINSDGSGLKQLSDVGVGHGGAHISADGNIVTWSDSKGLFTYNVKKDERTKMPEGIKVWSLAISGNGRWIFAWDYDTGSLFRIPIDGSDVQKIMTNEPPARLSGFPVNRNLWGSILEGPSVSHDGSKVAFQYAGEAFVMNGDGSQLKKLTNNKQEEKKYMGHVKLSGDGNRVSWYYPVPDQTMVIANQSGHVLTKHPKAPHLQNAEFTRDGQWLVMTHGLRFLAADSSQQIDLSHMGHNYPMAVRGAQMASISDDGRRACLKVDVVYEGEARGYQQLCIVDLFPETLKEVPTLENLRVTPRFLLNDGATRATITTKASGEELERVMGFLMKNGHQGATGEYGAVPLQDDGRRSGDETARDGIFSTNDLHIRPRSTTPVPPGPINLRVYAVNRHGNMLLIDVAGMESRMP